MLLESIYKFHVCVFYCWGGSGIALYTLPFLLTFLSLEEGNELLRVYSIISLFY